MAAVLRVPKAIWHDDQDVRELYGDNPNGITEDARAFNAGMTSNIVANMSYNGP